MNKALIGGVAAVVVAAIVSAANADFVEKLVQPQPADGSTDIPNIDVAESILNSPPSGATITNTTAATINDGFGSVAAPDYFAVRYSGQITSLDGVSTPGYTSTKTLYENSDDGFRFFVNGVVPAGNGKDNNGNADGKFEEGQPTGGANTTSSPISLAVGDYIQLDYYERNGGQFVVLRENNSNGVLVNDIAGGSTIGVTAPEPASVGLLGVGASGSSLAADVRTD